MDYKVEYEKLKKWKDEVTKWSDGVQASHVDPTLKVLGETAFLTKPFSEKIKVVSDYAKQVPGLKNDLAQNSQTTISKKMAEINKLSKQIFTMSV